MNKISEKNMNSVKNVVNLLREIIRNSKEYADDESLLDALSSQGKLANFHDAELSIYPTSINTMKRISNSIYDSGFEHVNKLRLKALESLYALDGNDEEVRGSTRSLKECRVLAKELKDKIKRLQLENLLLIQAIDRCKTDISEISSKEDHDKRIFYAEASIKKINGILKVNSKTSKSNVYNIG